MLGIIIDDEILQAAISRYDYIGLYPDTNIHVVFDFEINTFRHMRETSSIEDGGALLINGFVLREAKI